MGRYDPVKELEDLRVRRARQPLGPLYDRYAPDAHMRRKAAYNRDCDEQTARRATLAGLLRTLKTLPLDVWRGSVRVAGFALVAPVVLAASLLFILPIVLATVAGMVCAAPFVWLILRYTEPGSALQQACAAVVGLAALAIVVWLGTTHAERMFGGDK